MAICAVPPRPTVWTLCQLVLAGRVPDRVSLPSSPTSPSCPGTEGGRCRASGGTLSGPAPPCCGHSPAPCSNTESPSDGSNLTWLPPVLSPLLWLWSSDIPCRDIGESPWLWLVEWRKTWHAMLCHDIEKFDIFNTNIYLTRHMRTLLTFLQPPGPSGMRASHWARLRWRPSSSGNSFSLYRLRKAARSSSRNWSLLQGVILD